ncbi:MAG: hypothetical protein J6J38_07695 [Lachnospiraceae bacterium]|nr:hypothetical protein [Lachnospiraceae bacterium]
MKSEKRDFIERILEKAQKLAPEGKDFVAGYILGKEHQREEQKRQAMEHAVEQTA